MTDPMDARPSRPAPQTAPAAIQLASSPAEPVPAGIRAGTASRQTDPGQPPHDSSAPSRAPSWPSTVHVKGLVSTWQSASEVFRSARSRLERTLPGRIWTHLGELGFIDSSLQFAALFTLSSSPLMLMSVVLESPGAPGRMAGRGVRLPCTAIRHRPVTSAPHRAHHGLGRAAPPRSRLLVVDPALPTGRADNLAAAVSFRAGYRDLLHRRRRLCRLRTGVCSSPRRRHRCHHRRRGEPIDPAGYLTRPARPGARAFNRLYRLTATVAATIRQPGFAAGSPSLSDPCRRDRTRDQSTMHFLNQRMPSRIAATSLVPNFTVNTPAPMNALALAAACAMTCSSTPASAAGAPKLTPIARMPMCSTLE